MCFSATGSFSVAAVLAGVGAVSVAQKKLDTHHILAATPLLFAAQQVAEGMVWRTINDPDQATLHLAAVAVFLGFALVVYPTWSPLSLFVAERNPRRRKILGALLAFGIFGSIYAAAMLIQHRPVARIANHSITYSYHEAGSSLVLALYLPGYVLATVVPFFVSTMNKAKVMGGVLVVGLVATFLIKRQELTSVWCFFAAVMSGVIVLSIAAEHKIARLAAEHRGSEGRA
jgi:MFS family permease